MSPLSARLLGTVGLALAATGCRATTVTYPYCPAPVYLSAVDRIGGGTASRDGAKRVGPLEAKIETSSQTSNDDTVTVEMTAGELTAELLRALPVGDEVHQGEVHVDGVHMSSRAWFHFGIGQAAIGTPKGTIEVLE